MSSPICILTDNTAQFPQGVFSGQRLVKTLPLRISERSASAPALEDFLRIFSELERDFSGILVLTMSNHIIPVADVAQAAALQHGGTAQIRVLDSKQTGPGLGMLAQLGAQAILTGVTLTELEDRLRAAISSIYTILHIDSESLTRAAFPSAQVDALEAGSLPLLTLDDGQLVPYKKIRTRRHLLESFQEFIEEFETPEQIACLHGRESAIRARSLREIAVDNFPEVPFAEMETPAPLARLFGPETVGVVILEPGE